MLCTSRCALSHSVVHTAGETIQKVYGQHASVPGRLLCDHKGAVPCCACLLSQDCKLHADSVVYVEVDLQLFTNHSMAESPARERFVTG